ncbi:MAG: hypothetical protein Q3972_05680, partial [Corynebacterium sp.]|nr:hypothetical protein [Corynebacterium sp.]
MPARYIPRHRTPSKHGRLAVSTLLSFSLPFSMAVLPTNILPGLHATAHADEYSQKADSRIIGTDNANWAQNTANAVFPAYQGATTYPANLNSDVWTNYNSGITQTLNYTRGSAGGFELVTSITDPSSFTPIKNNEAVTLNSSVLNSEYFGAKGVYLFTNADISLPQFQIGNENFQARVNNPLAYNIQNSTSTVIRQRKENSMNNVWNAHTDTGLTFVITDPQIRAESAFWTTFKKGDKYRTTYTQRARLWNTVRLAIVGQLNETIKNLDDENKKKTVAAARDAIDAMMQADTDAMVAGTSGSGRNALEYIHVMENIVRGSNPKVPTSVNSSGYLDDTYLTMKSLDTTRAVLKKMAENANGGPLTESKEGSTNAALLNLNDNSTAFNVYSTADNIVNPKEEEQTTDPEDKEEETTPVAEDQATVNAAKEQAKKLINAMSYLTENSAAANIKLVEESTTSAQVLDRAKSAMQINVTNGNKTITENQATAADVNAISSLDNFRDGNLGQYMDVNINKANALLKEIQLYKDNGYFDDVTGLTGKDDTRAIVNSAIGGLNVVIKEGSAEDTIKGTTNSLQTYWNNFLKAQLAGQKTTANKLIDNMSFLSKEEVEEAKTAVANAKTVQEVRDAIRDAEVKNVEHGKVADSTLDAPDTTTFATEPGIKLSSYPGDFKDFSDYWENKAKDQVTEAEETAKTHGYAISSTEAQDALDNAIQDLKDSLKDENTPELQYKSQVEAADAAIKTILKATVEPVQGEAETDITDEQKAQAHALINRMSYITPVLRQTANDLIDATFFMKELVALLQEISRINIVQGNAGTSEYAAVDAEDQIRDASSVTSLDTVENTSTAPYFDYYHYQRTKAINKHNDLVASDVYTTASADLQQAYDQAYTALANTPETASETELAPYVAAFFPARDALYSAALSHDREAFISILNRMSFLTGSEVRQYQQQANAALSAAALTTIGINALNTNIRTGNTTTLIPTDQQISNTPQIDTYTDLITTTTSPYFDYYRTLGDTTLTQYADTPNTTAYKLASTTAQTAYTLAYQAVQRATSTTAGYYPEYEVRELIQDLVDKRTQLASNPASRITRTPAQLITTYINRMSYLTDEQRAHYLTQAANATTTEEALAIGKDALAQAIDNATTQNPTLPKGDTTIITSIADLDKGNNRNYYDQARTTAQTLLNNTTNTTNTEATNTNPEYTQALNQLQTLL